MSSPATRGSTLRRPHVEVHNGDAVSVALSVTCRTRGTRREYVMHALRRQLHRLAQRSRNGTTPS